MTPGIREAMRVSRAKVNDMQSSHIDCPWECISYLSNGACFLVLWGRCIVVRSCQVKWKLKYSYEHSSAPPVLRRGTARQGRRFFMRSPSVASSPIFLLHAMSMMFFGLGNLFYGPYAMPGFKFNANLMQSPYSVSTLWLSCLKTDS